VDVEKILSIFNIFSNQDIVFLYNKLLSVKTEAGKVVD